MLYRSILLLAMIAVFTGGVYGDQSTASTQPTTTQAVQVDPKIDGILTRLEKAGHEIGNLQSKISHELHQIIPDDRQTKLGLIRYRAADEKQDAKFMIHFDTLIHEDLKLRQKEWFCFDGKWLREIRDQTRTTIDREVVSPNERVDPFRLGEGPFPLPFGQKKSEILENFDVTLADEDKKDPPATDHLILIPKAGTTYARNYVRVNFWVDRKLDLPVRIATRDRHSNVITVDFDEIKINEGIADDLLWIESPKGYGYQREPLAR